MKRKVVTSLLATAVAVAVSSGVAHASPIDEVVIQESEVTVSEESTNSLPAVEEISSEDATNASPEVENTASEEEIDGNSIDVEDTTTLSKEELLEKIEAEWERINAIQEGWYLADKEQRERRKEAIQAALDIMVREKFKEAVADEATKNVENTEVADAAEAIESSEVEDRFVIAELNYNGKPIVDKVTPNGTKYAPVNYSDSWEYSLQNNPGISYSMYYYADTEDIMSSDIVIGIFNDNGQKRVAYIEFEADKVGFADGSKFILSTEYLSKLYGKPFNVRTYGSNKDLSFAVDAGVVEFNYSGDNLMSVMMINNELFEKYQDSNNLLAISQDPLSTIYGKELNNGVARESYESSYSYGFFNKK